MTWSIIAISVAFLWLLYETRLMTVRLRYGKPQQVLDLVSLVPYIIGVGILLIAFNKYAGTQHLKQHKFKTLFRRWLNYQIG